MMAAHICWSQCLSVCSLDDKGGLLRQRDCQGSPFARGTYALQKHLTSPLHALDPFPEPFVNQHDGQWMPNYERR